MIYRCSVMDKYKEFHWNTDDDHPLSPHKRVMLHYHEPGSSIRCDWRELNLKWVIDKKSDSKKKIPDISRSIAVDLIFNEKNLDIIYPIEKKNCELLPMGNLDGERYLALHCITYLNVFDEGRAIFRRPGVPPWSYHVDFAFKNIDLNEHYIFLCGPKNQLPATIYTQKFKDLIERHHLKGLEFTKLPMIDDPIRWDPPSKR